MGTKKGKPENTSRLPAVAPQHNGAHAEKYMAGLLPAGFLPFLGEMDDLPVLAGYHPELHQVIHLMELTCWVRGMVTLAPRPVGTHAAEWWTAICRQVPQMGRGADAQHVLNEVRHEDFFAGVIFHLGPRQVGVIAAAGREMYRQSWRNHHDPTLVPLAQAAGVLPCRETAAAHPLYPGAEVFSAFEVGRMRRHLDEIPNPPPMRGNRGQFLPAEELADRWVTWLRYSALLCYCPKHGAYGGDLWHLDEGDNIVSRRMQG